MAVEFGIRGVHPDYDADLPGTTWASFHGLGALALFGALELDTCGQMRAAELSARVDAVRNVVDAGTLPDDDLVRRLEILAGICDTAGQLGLIWWG